MTPLSRFLAFLVFPLLFATAGSPVLLAQDKTDDDEEKVVGRVLTESDAMGRALKVIFLDKNLRRTTKGTLSVFLQRITLGTEGFSSVKLSYAGKGANELPVSWEFFGTDGKPVLTSLGFAKISMTLNDEGKVVECRYLDIEGELVNNKNGFSTIRRSYTGTSDMIREAYFDKDDRLALNINLGYAAMNVAYIKSDQEEYEEKTYQDTQGNPIKVNGAFKHVQGIYKGDDPMNIIRSYNNLDDTLMNGPDGYAVHITRPIASEKNPKEAYLDDKGKLVDGPEGYAQLSHTMDPETGDEKLQFLNVKGEVVNNPRLKWATRTFKRDPKGEIVDSVYYDVKGNKLKKEQIIQ